MTIKQSLRNAFASPGAGFAEVAPRQVPAGVAAPFPAASGAARGSAGAGDPHGQQPRR